ncbi:MAG: HAD-IIA family hydrolase [Butyrivibrio sp.]|nr:HAD-IIA family hydrolase [Butyrivibrio sp.]
MDQSKIELLNKTELFVLDMDGTFYLENDIIPGSLEFLSSVVNAGKDYIFFTNNASSSPKLYIEKLAKMNCHITRERIMTSADVTIEFLRSEYPGKSVYLLGTPALTESMLEAGIILTNDTDKKPDIVLASFDKTLTYEKLVNACNYIREGAIFLATHMDINCPVKDGFIPDCGAICAAIELSTGVKPRFLGKPFKETLDMIERVTKKEKEKITFVGDRLYTDVATGVNNGANGILVLTGECGIADIDKSPVKPTAVFESLSEIGKFLDEIYS